MKTNTTIEHLFEHATEDLGTLLWALRAWPSDDERCSSDYIALRLFSSCGRVRAAHAILKDVEAADYLPEKNKFEKVFQKACVEYEQFLSDEKALIEKILNDEDGLMARLQETESLLLTIRKIVQDGMLFDRPELFSDEYNEAVSSFLTGLNDFARFLDAVPPTFRACEGFGRLQGRFVAVETLVRQWHGVFHAAQERLDAERAREYDADFWWLHESAPVYDMTRELLISDENLPAIGQRLKTFKGTCESCPDESVLDDYALGRVLSDSASLERHVAACRLCREHIAARRESEAIRKGEMPIRPFLANLFKSSAEARFLTLDYSNEEALLAALNKVPTQVVSSEGQVRDGGKLMTLDAHRHKKKQLEQAEALARLQALRPDPESLPRAADSGTVDITWGKSVEIKNNIIVNIVFFPVLLRQKVFTDTHLLVAGSLTLPPLGTSGHTWFCEWVNPDGGIVPMDKFEVKHSLFKAAFPRSAVREAGEFRLLLACEN